MITERITHELRALGSATKAADLSRFFKTGPGEYGEGDRFLGVPVPDVRRVARRHQANTRAEAVGPLLESPLHEVRLCGLLILVEHYERAKSPAVRAAVRGADLDATGAPAPLGPGETEAFVTSVRRALYGSKIAAYAQGFDLIAAAGAENGWDVDLGAMARIWRGGCIIRARFLDDIARAYGADRAPVSLLTAPVFASAVRDALPAWREVVALAARSGVAAPAFASSLAYVDQLRAPRLPAALIQGQRDFFGSHTYRRVDDADGVYHVLWAQEGRAEEKWG